MVRVGEDRASTEYRHKPDDPDGDLICAEILVFNTTALVSHLERAHDDVVTTGGAGDMGDIGDDILPGATESMVRVALFWGSAPGGPRPSGFALSAGMLDPPDDDEDRSV